MDRVNKIINNAQFRNNLEKIKELEKDRIYCRHNLQHFLDVARVAYIISLEKKFKLSKEVIYASALLHDIGKWRQYVEGIDHSIASAEIAEGILKDCFYSKDEISIILEAIKKHRTGENLITELDLVLYEGDKRSRLCVDCNSIKSCKRFINDERSLDVPLL